jgi:hypothetical protein
VLSGNPANAVADNYVTTIGTPLTVTAAAGVLVNDTDAEQDFLQALFYTGTVGGIHFPVYGSVSLNLDGSFTYTPQAGFTGLDGFGYLAYDGTTLSNIGVVLITVNPAANQPPQAQDDAYGVARNGVLSVSAANGLLANDIDPESDLLTVEVISQPTHGSLNWNSNGSFIYTPHTGFSGSDTFTYRAKDSLRPSNVATVTVGVSDAPQGQTDSYVTLEDQSLSVGAPGVLANDSDPNGNPLSALLETQPSHGTVALANNGSFLYTPTANYFGEDSFTYRPYDGFVTGDPVIVNIVVQPTPDAPVAVLDSYTLNEDSVLVVPAVGLLLNDFHPDGGTLLPELGSLPLHGTLNWTGNGSFTYTPAVNFFGVDTFTYRVSDGVRQSSYVSVNLNVQPVNDAPTALADSYVVKSTSNAPSTITVLGYGSSGYRYQQVPNGGGPADFFLPGFDDSSFALGSAAFGNGTSNGPVGATPQSPWTQLSDLLVRKSLPLPADATNVRVSVAIDDGVQVFFNGVDISGGMQLQPNPTIFDQATYAIPESLLIKGGVNLLAIRARDTGGGTFLDIAIRRGDPAALSVVAGSGVLQNDQDIDNDSLRALLTKVPQHGTVVLHADGSFSYRPAAGYVGPDSFSYRAADPAGGLAVYTVNTATDELVSINASTGVSTVVGPIGHDMFATDLAYMNGVIYAVTSNSANVFGNPGWTLVAINPATGAKISAMPLKIGSPSGPYVAVAESVTARAGQLILGYGYPNLTSSRLGSINPATGVVTDLMDLGPGADLDAFGTDFFGNMISVDGIGYSGNINQIAFYRTTVGPITHQFFGDYLTAGGPSDLTFLGPIVYGMDPLNRRLNRVQIDPRVQPLADLPLIDAPTTYDGIVFAPDFQASSTTVTINVTAEAPPVAHAGGPYLINEGSSLTLNASGSHDPNGDSLTFAWDLNGDGQFVDAAGVAPTLTWAELESLGLSGGPATISNLRVRVDDGFGNVVTSSATSLGIQNVAPIAQITGSGGYRGETRSFTLTASDVAADQLQPFTYAIDWDGNGTFDQTVIGAGTGVVVPHVFVASGTQSVRVKATDHNGGTSAITTRSVITTDYVLRDDGTGKIDLIWGGTPGIDVVYFYTTVSANVVGVFNQYANLPQQLAAVNIGALVGGVTGKVIAHGYGGDDVIVAELLVSRAASLLGGDGNDTLVGGRLADSIEGGNGHDLLLGATQASDGGDRLIGGDGDDVLIAFAGADTLLGGAGSDLLIGGGLTFSTELGGLPRGAIAVYNEWSLSGHTLSARKANLLGTDPQPDRLNQSFLGNYYLLAGSTVLADNAVDSMTGGDEEDWFFGTLDQDLAVDRALSELFSGDQ